MNNLSSFCFRSKWPQKARQTDVHKISDVRIRERIPHEPLPHAKETYRNGPRALSHGTTDKNMVSESKDEVKERDTSDKGVK